MSITIAQVTVPFHVATQLPDGYRHVLAVTPFGYTEARIVTSAELIDIVERLEEEVRRMRNRVGPSLNEFPGSVRLATLPLMPTSAFLSDRRSLTSYHGIEPLLHARR